MEQNDPTMKLASMVCAWREDYDGIWNTECNGMFQITEGTPMLNDMRYCCYCGRLLDQVDYDG